MEDSLERKNTLLENPEEEKPQGKKPGFRIYDIDFNINKENAPKLLPLIFYICFWIIIYIANHHYGEKTLLNMDKLRREMKNLKADYYTGNAELSNRSIQTNVAKMVEPLGLKELSEPPKKIIDSSVVNEH